MARDKQKLSAKNVRGQELRRTILNRAAQEVGFDTWTKIETAVKNSEYILRSGEHIETVKNTTVISPIGEVEINRSNSIRDHQEGQIDFYFCVCEKEVGPGLKGFRIENDFKFCPDCGAKIVWID